MNRHSDGGHSMSYTTQVFAGPPLVARGPAALRQLLAPALVAALLAGYLVVAGPRSIDALHSAAGASPMWLLTGLAGTVGSMIVFALLRRQTLAVGGARVSLRRTLAVSYGAGAVHTTLPAGAVFSTTYAFRHLRANTASTAATTWSMTVTGILSAVTLSAVAVIGLLLNAGGSAAMPLLEILVALIILIGLTRARKHPEALISAANRMLILMNRLRRRPAETGIVWLSTVLSDLRKIRPSARSWFVAVCLALLNWALDLACLAACCAAVGVHVSFAALLLSYTAGMAAGSLLPVPGGLGAVETAMTVALTVAGATASPALAAALLYRVLSTGSVVVIGWLVIAAQRLRLRHEDQRVLA